MNSTPAMTSAMSTEPFSARRCFSEDWTRLNTIARHAVRDQQPFLLSVRRRTAENVDSIGFVVRR